MAYDNLSIKSGHPALPGHFPGNPVVPGVVVLQMIVDALAASHPSRAITGIQRVKFLKPVLPDTPFRIEYSETREGGFKVCAQAGDLLVEGRFQMAPADAVEEGKNSDGMR